MSTYLAFKSFCSVLTIFKKRVVHTKFHMYIFISKMSHPIRG